MRKAGSWGEVPSVAVPSAVVPLVVVLCVGLALAGTAPEPSWIDLHDGGALYNDDGYLCRIAPDGHPVVAGESTEATGGVDLLVRKLDRSDGGQIWQFRYEGYDGKDISVNDMTWDSVGQLLVAGFIRGCVG